ncbi:NADP-dependent oxidoreductase [Nocardioides halotolerans]|uniref:NADP-dependent oxidoreductase n=1 Tax=Nocardioides halotolerans TaxID=433660 RepID=UPI00048BDC82|nr:NADP-dependent oxidoreductase [Nocardioides halotolerans]
MSSTTSTSTKPATFRAAVVTQPGATDAISVLDLPVVAPEPGQVRVAVAAATVNPVDLAVRAGVFHQAGVVHQPEHTGLGWDFAGTVLEAGPGVDLAPGTRVAGLVGGLDRDFGTYAEQLVLPASDVAVVPDGLDLTEAATVPLNALTALQLVEILGDGDGRSLLVTGAAGAVGGYVVPLALERGWRVTGLARAADEEFVRGLGADFTVEQTSGWDVVADAGALQEQAVALVRDGGRFVGVQPSFLPAAERGVSIEVVSIMPDGAAIAGLLERTARGELSARVAEVLPLDRFDDAHAAVAKGGVRGRYVLVP